MTLCSHSTPCHTACAGVTDIHLLFTIAALMASCMLFGWQMEVRHGRTGLEAAESTPCCAFL